MNNLIIASINREQVRPWLEVLSPQYSLTFIDKIELLFSIDKQYDKDTLLVLDAQLINEENQIPLICQHIKKVIIVGDKLPPSQQIQFIYEGACGYSDTLIDKQLIARTIESVLKNEIWLKRELIPLMLKGIVAKQHFIEHEKLLENKSFQSISILTQREIEVAEHVYNGEENISIAEKLNISNRTVKAHLSAIFRKLNVQGRFQLVILLKDLQIGNLANANNQS